MDRRRFVKSVGCAGTLAAATQLPAGASCMDEMMRISQNRPSAHGMGYVVLDKDKSFVEQVTQDNTIYEIRYDFDLEGQTKEIPAGCVLKFEGGCLKNGTLSADGTLLANAWGFVDVLFAEGTVLDFTCQINVPNENTKEFLERILALKPKNSDNPTIFNFNSALPYTWEGTLRVDRRNVKFTGGGTIQGHIYIGLTEDDYIIAKSSWVKNHQNIAFENLTFNKYDKVDIDSISMYIRNNASPDNIDDIAISLCNINHVKIANCFFENVPFPIVIPPNTKYISGKPIIQQCVRRVNICNCDFEMCHTAVYAKGSSDNVLEYGDLEFCFNNVYPYVYGMNIKNIDGFKCYNNVFNRSVNDNNGFVGVNIKAEGCFMQVCNNGFYGESNQNSLLIKNPVSLTLCGNGFYAQHSLEGTLYDAGREGCVRIEVDSAHYVNGCVITNNLFSSVYALPILINDKKIRGLVIDGNTISDSITNMYKRTLYFVPNGIAANGSEKLQSNYKGQYFYAHKNLLELRMDAITAYHQNRSTYNSKGLSYIDMTDSYNGKQYRIMGMSKCKPVTAVTFKYNLSSGGKHTYMFDGRYFEVDYGTDLNKTSALSTMKSKIDGMFSHKFSTSIIAGILWIVGKETSTEVYSPFIEMGEGAEVLDVLYQNLGYRVKLYDKDNKNIFNKTDYLNAIDSGSSDKIVVSSGKAFVQKCLKQDDKNFTIQLLDAPAGFSEFYLLDDTYFAKMDDSVSTNDTLSAIIALCYSDRYSVSGKTLTSKTANEEYSKLYAPYAWYYQVTQHVVDVEYTTPDGIKYNPTSDSYNDNGASGGRPTGVRTGFCYFDTTIGKPIWWNGTDWVDNAGATV